MSSATSYPDYDPFARAYNEVFGQGFSALTLPLLEKLLLPHLPDNTNILDLCCGTGHLAQKLLIKGYQVTGIDGSQEMLGYARENAAGGKFIRGDVRFFELPPTFHGVVSMYALNYVMNLEELTSVFQKVYAALQANGLFVFNLRLEEEFQSDWNGYITGNVRENYAWISQQSYHPEEKIGKIKITGFQKITEENWQRLDFTLIEKGYASAEIESALKNVGFTEVSVYNEKRDLAEPRTPGSGYAYFVGHKVGEN